MTGWTSTVSGKFATVNGGGQHHATRDYTAVSGGFNNEALADLSSVVCESRNRAFAKGSVIAKEDSNYFEGEYAVVVVGSEIQALNLHSVISGGHGNQASTSF